MTVKKPFGIVLATNKAAEAIRASLAPVSVILHNLLLIQRASVFPKDLQAHDFSVSRGVTNEQDKRVIMKIMEALRSPHNSVAELLENHITNGWQVKIAPVVKHTPANKSAGKKSVAKKPQRNKFNVKASVSTPVVVVKKTRSSI